ncbi:N-formylglutamate amidohydrolase [Legionella norrlandica]|uniref:N-formylglutamate amidohydrolase n=1 Tax=Legionella norrlandica TaxID=1498499 RepID=A0A0A2T4Y9_9GAMM|nr:N-formylglutamate amidohydrolase [Legionella norrlandica]KGP62483.1 N-formylglutamate amidohydrolase [Legionella norrlandica]
MKKLALVVSCEHAVNTVPPEYQKLFEPHKELLESHRGLDLGALEVAESIHRMNQCNLYKATCTRLLVDCNRSANHPNCFTEITKTLSDDEKKKILNQYYFPFRNQVINNIQQFINQELQVWHLSVHSFTPKMNNLIRTTDIGILYDPQRSSEKALSKQWQKEIKTLYPEYKVRMNYPYKGISNGFTTSLRKKYTPDEYIGIELEVNQKFTLGLNHMNNLKNILALSVLKIMC